MGSLKKVAVVGALAAVSSGLAVTSAAGYAISGGSYVGAPTGTTRFTVNGYALDCPATATSFVGTATGSATTRFTPTYSASPACTLFSLPETVTHSGTWSVTVTGGPSGGWYTGRLTFDSGAATSVISTYTPCMLAITGTQVFDHGVNANVVRARNVTGGIEIELAVNGLAYTMASCFFISGNNGTYSTGAGAIVVPGVTIT